MEKAGAPLREKKMTSAPWTGEPSFYDICSSATGFAGNLFSLVLFLSPIPTFRRIARNRSTEHFSGLPYLFSLLNCCICLWYGLPFVSHGVVLIATVNFVGATFQLIYITIFIIFADNIKRLKICGLLIGVFSLIGLIVYVSLVMFEHQARQTFIGYLSVASLISMFASPLFIMNLVIRTRSVEFMPFHLSFGTFLMSISFFAYGLLMHDFFIYLPNGIGSLLGVTQLWLYAHFSRRSREGCGLPLLVF
ncbi:hypothetical protein HPP92_020152 [Vanilla planifolia]|uniref:Bidirectional sugar transporter SWEET n=1 Tax=Vanilla planifolia TaxID=51239 RepID=A0A835Q3L9_VANPL|nr:hypothetical protein HPP92_020152 [Vanilla planifolia]